MKCVTLDGGQPFGEFNLGDTGIIESIFANRLQGGGQLHGFQHLGSVKRIIADPGDTFIEGDLFQILPAIKFQCRILIPHSIAVTSLAVCHNAGQAHGVPNGFDIGTACKNRGIEVSRDSYLFQPCAGSECAGAHTPCQVVGDDQLRQTIAAIKGTTANGFQTFREFHRSQAAALKCIIFNGGQPFGEFNLGDTGIIESIFANFGNGAAEENLLQSGRTIKGVVCHIFDALFKNNRM